MNSRERLLCTINGEIPDRVPVAPFVQEEYLTWYWPNKKTVDRVLDAVKLATDLDFDLMAKHRKFERPYFLNKNFPNWEVSETAHTANGIRTIRTEIATPEKTLVQVEKVPDAGGLTVGLHTTTTEHLLTTEADIAVFLKYLPSLDDETIKAMHETAKVWKRIIGDRGLVAPFGWAGVFNFTAELRGIERLLIDPYDDEELYAALMGRITNEMVKYCTAYGETDIDCIGIQGHMANSRTVSAAYFGEYIQPYEKKMIDSIHASGCHSIYHNCGFASSLYENYRALGMSVWETISEAPQGDNVLANVKEIVGNDLCLLGNLDQIDFLKTASPEEVAQRAREIVQTGKPGGRFIFSTSDFLERNTPLENVKAMINAAKEEGAY